MLPAENENLQCTPHLYFYRGEQDYKRKTAFLQTGPQSSINTEPNSAFANRRLLSIKVSKKADFGIDLFDRTCDGGLVFFYNILRMHVTLMTFVSIHLTPS